jgi:hypothetical protein
MRRRPRTLALGVWLAARGGTSVLALAIAGLGALASVVAALALRRSSEPLGAALPAVASSGVAWSAGVLLAFGASMRALARDGDEGVVALARARGVSASHYAQGRIAGLAIVLAAAVGGATSVAWVAALAAAGPSAQLARAGAGAVAYALAFAATLAPVALATLGGSSRSRGYLAFLAVLALPELLAPWTANHLPGGWRELTSIPAALAAVRAGIAAPVANGAPMARAIAALAALAAASSVVAVARVRGADRREAA